MLLLQPNLMEIGLDFDGVISDCGKLKTYWAKELYGVDIPSERFKKELIIKDKILTLEQYRELQIQIYGVREFGLLMEPVPGVLELAPKLQREGHNLSIITSRGEKESEIAREWMRKYGLDIQLVGVGYGVSKADACNGLEVYIDDDLDKLKSVINVVPYRYLFSWGYNQHMEVPKEVARRINSWKSFYEEIQRLNSD